MNMIIRNITTAVARKDASLLHTNLIKDFIATRSAFTRTAFLFFEKHPSNVLVRIVTIGYALMSSLILKIKRNKSINILTYYPYPSHKKAIEQYLKRQPKKNATQLEKKWIFAFHYSNIITLFKLLIIMVRKWKTVNKVSIHVSKKYPLFIHIRIISALFYYFYFYLNDRNLPKAVILSSDSDPLLITLAIYYNKTKRNTILVSHALFQPVLAPIRWDITILDGAYNLSLLQQNHCIIGEYHLKKPEYEITTEKLNTNISSQILILLSKFPNWDIVIQLINFLQQKIEPKKIFLKPHPYQIKNNYFYSTINKKGIEIIDVTLPNINYPIDLAIAGNSAVHLDCLIKKIPTIYYKKLDNNPYDLYAFVKNKSIYEMTELTIECFKKYKQFYKNYNLTNTLKIYQ